MIKLHFRIADEGVRADMAAARKDLGKGVKSGLERAVERVALPAARLSAPHKRGTYRSKLFAKATTRRAFLEARTPYAGILNFGGVRRDTIRPKRAHALSTPAGPRAAVRGPRRYRASHHLEKVVAATRDEVIEAAQDELVKVFEGNGLKVT